MPISPEFNESLVDQELIYQVLDYQAENEKHSAYGLLNENEKYSTTLTPISSLIDPPPQSRSRL